MRSICGLQIIVACACLLGTGLSVRAEDVRLGKMPAGKILFLGNSITACPPKWWGLAASTTEKDYAHLLAAAIDAKAGGHLSLVGATPATTGPDGSSDVGGSNIVNIADVFERGYASYDASKLRKQLDWKADIVILQFGENIPMVTFNAEVFTTSLKKLVADIKASGNPRIFVLGYILGANPNIDEIKRKMCEEDPAQRVFIDLSNVGKDSSNIGDYGHPNDKGMALIAETVFQAILAHSAAESSSQ